VKPAESVPVFPVEAWSHDLREGGVKRSRRYSSIASDNMPDGKGHPLVARFISAELVRVTHGSPDWLKRLFGRELRGQS
jgi:hypothetical protein